MSNFQGIISNIFNNLMLISPNNIADIKNSYGLSEFENAASVFVF